MGIFSVQYDVKATAKFLCEAFVEADTEEEAIQKVKELETHHIDDDLCKIEEVQSVNIESVALERKDFLKMFGAVVI